MCAIATPSKDQKPGLTPIAPVTSQPPQEPVTPRRVIKGSTNMPCRHMGFSTGSLGSNVDSSNRAIEPAQPATSAVCIKCTEISRPGSFRTTVCTRYQGRPIDYAPPCFDRVLIDCFRLNITPRQVLLLRKPLFPQALRKIIPIINPLIMRTTLDEVL